MRQGQTNTDKKEMEEVVDDVEIVENEEEDVRDDNRVVPLS